ncbi:MAG: DUF61 family protein [Candidatus Bathyarchaeia archaeon]
MFDSRRPLDRALDAFLGHELRKLNTHLPKQRRSLTELLKLKDPTVEATDGSAILLKRSELEELARIVPTEYQDRLKLPIIIMRRMELDRSIYTVSGERVEEFTVKKILGLTKDEYYQTYKDREPAYLYRPQVTELLRKFHTIFVIAFGIPKELSDYGPSLP